MASESSLINEGGEWPDRGYLLVEIRVVACGRELSISLADDLTWVQPSLWTAGTLRSFDTAVSQMRAALEG